MLLNHPHPLKVEAFRKPASFKRSDDDDDDDFHDDQAGLVASNELADVNGRAQRATEETEALCASTLPSEHGTKQTSRPGLPAL